PLKAMLSDEERAALAAFPGTGYHVSEVAEHDPAALNGLRSRGLIQLEGDRQILTGAGRAYKAHILRAEDA
ncbi:MAG: hypothetical protein R3185_04060, partial [Candidatus Thermoplasmatota archaeon]|nr:hypothetical protein [Candidatus Thermoplasmatota archaeon]